MPKSQHALAARLPSVQLLPSIQARPPHCAQVTPQQLSHFSPTFACRRRRQRHQRRAHRQRAADL